MQFTHFNVKICCEAEVMRSGGTLERKNMLWRQLAAFYRYAQLGHTGKYTQSRAVSILVKLLLAQLYISSYKGNRRQSCEV